MYILETNRLYFRNWKEEDRSVFYKMNSDPEVMKYFPKILSMEESNFLFDKFVKNLALKPYGFWAVQRKDTGDLIGFIGLSDVLFKANFTPCVEIGWRILKSEWGKGFATEGANECLQFAFDILKLEMVYSFTSTLNKKSESVMKKIGMYKVGEFNHPNLSFENPLNNHVLYAIDYKKYSK